MSQTYSVSLKKIIDEFSLESIFMPADPDSILISTADINRPGLALSGFFNYFDDNRIQIIGLNESSFLEQFPQEQRQQRVIAFMEHRPPAVIVCRELGISDELLSAAKALEVPLLRTQDATSSFMSALISFLSVRLAPRITRHGVLVEVYGEGVLILGESGVGKSETAIELIKRGHRLIADDAVEIRKVSSKSLVGSAPENIRHFIELRGIGIINARRLFGIGSVKLTEKIDLIINMELWNKDKMYDRMGLEDERTEILGIAVPSVTIPVKPGRNLAVIIEVAAMNNRQKKMGYYAAHELLQRLGMESDSAAPTPIATTEWDAF